MKKLFYPVVFHPEESGYSVSVPDIEGCFSQGETLEEACEMAKDAIGLCLEEYAAQGQEFPAASSPGELSLEEGDFVALVDFDPLEYRKKHDNRAVKKTVTIPSWLNTLAEEQHLSFSGILQEGLKQHLNLS